jgi:hypothetical protein
MGDSWVIIGRERGEKGERNDPKAIPKTPNTPIKQ